MNKIDNIANLLNNNSKKCLAINGTWGIGKTYLWKQVEKKLSEVDKDKKVVYIDLFGKESYKQILEEIVVSLHGDYNKITKTTFKGLEGLVKGISGGLINIDSDTIFSFLKKEDFNNIIVCFDNIERRSDNLSLKEILGLVNLLKEDKECSVVMIFHEDELKEQDNNSPIDNKKNDKNWYQIYKEKIIDCEITIRNNDEVAKAIIKEKISKYTKTTNDIKNIIENIIFERYKNNAMII